MKGKKKRVTCDKPTIFELHASFIIEEKMTRNKMIWGKPFFFFLPLGTVEWDDQITRWLPRANNLFN
jgi:hypothetical protein